MVKFQVQKHKQHFSNLVSVTELYEKERLCLMNRRLISRKNLNCSSNSAPWNANNCWMFVNKRWKGHVWKYTLCWKSLATWLNIYRKSLCIERGIERFFKEEIWNFSLKTWACTDCLPAPQLKHACKEDVQNIACYKQ